MKWRVHVQMDPSGKSKGPPPMVKKVLSLFGSGREEDKMVGYLSFLKVRWLLKCGHRQRGLVPMWLFTVYGCVTLLPLGRSSTAK